MKPRRKQDNILQRIYNQFDKLFTELDKQQIIVAFHGTKEGVGKNRDTGFRKSIWNIRLYIEFLK